MNQIQKAVIGNEWNKVRREQDEHLLLKEFTRAIGMPQDVCYTFMDACKRTSPEKSLRMSLKAWRDTFPDCPIEVEVRTSEAMKALGRASNMLSEKQFAGVVGKQLMEFFYQCDCGSIPAICLLRISHDKDIYALHSTNFELGSLLGGTLLVRVSHEGRKMDLKLNSLKQMSLWLTEEFGDYFRR